MHDLNDALDELRAVIPYAHGPSVRKLSKIATLLLAKNYILMQVGGVPILPLPLLTTREAAWYIISVALVCLFVCIYCMYVFQTITFEP